MFKRIMLTLAFVAAFSTAGIGLTNTAQAWRGGWGGGWGRPYGAYYAPRAAFYRPAVFPYRAYYGPRIIAPYYPAYYAYPYPVYSDYYYGPPAGVSVSFGF